MILRHYSKAPLGPLRNVEPRPARNPGKPRGFWLSDESEYGWSQWCDDAEFGIGNCWTDFDVDLSRVLVLRSDAEIMRLHRRFPNRAARRWNLWCFEIVDWQKIGEAYGGILITPYSYAMRRDVGWYYGWDCASGCFWDVSCLREVGRGMRQEAA